MENTHTRNTTLNTIEHEEDYLSDQGETLHLLLRHVYQYHRIRILLIAVPSPS